MRLRSVRASNSPREDTKDVKNLLARCPWNPNCSVSAHYIASEEIKAVDCEDQLRPA